MDPWAPARGHEQPVATQLAPVLELEDVVLVVAPRGGRAHGQDDLDALTAQDLAERLAQRRGLTAEQVLGLLDHHRLAAESPHGLRHLDADRATAQDEQTAGNGLHPGRLAVGPHPVELVHAGDRRHDRVGAVGEHDVGGCVALAADLHDARAGEPAGAAQEIDAVVRQPALLSGVGVVRDHEVAPRERRVHVDLGARRGVERAVTASPGRSSVFDGMQAQ